jgi:hypothetical protein
MAEVFVVTVTAGSNAVELRYTQQNPALAVIPLLLAATPRPDSVQIVVEDE